MSDEEPRTVADLDESIQTLYRTSRHRTQKFRVHVRDDCWQLQRANEIRTTERAACHDDDPVCRACDPQSEQTKRGGQDQDRSAYTLLTNATPEEVLGDAE